MKKYGFLLPLLFLTSCGADKIPSNKPYYCEGPYKAWMETYPEYAFDGSLVKEGKNLYFVNKTKTNHGFHGVISEKTEFYENNNKIELKDIDSNHDVIAVFNPMGNYQTWIKVTNMPIPEEVERIYFNTPVEEIEKNYTYFVYDHQK